MEWNKLEYINILREKFKKIVYNKIFLVVFFILVFLYFIFFSYNAFKNKYGEKKVENNPKIANYIGQSTLGINTETKKRVGNYIGDIFLKKINNQYIVDSTFVPCLLEDHIEKIDSQKLKTGVVPKIIMQFYFGGYKYLFVDERQYLIDDFNVYTRYVLNIPKEDIKENSTIVISVITGEIKKDFTYSLKDFQEVKEDTNLRVIDINKEYLRAKKLLVEKEKLKSKLKDINKDIQTDDYEALDAQIKELNRKIRNVVNAINLFNTFKGKMVI